MRKIYSLDEIDCANCAAKLENTLSKIDGVNYVNINFIAQKLTIEIDDGNFDEVMKKVVKTTAREEPDCKIVL